MADTERMKADTERMKADERAEMRYEAKRRGNSRRIWTIVIIVIVVIVIVAIIVWLLFFLPGSPARVGQGASCTSNNNCNSGLVCSAGKCRIAPEGLCTSNGQCSNGYVCDDLTCHGALGALCSGDAQCAQPFICDGGVCNYEACTISSHCRDATKEECKAGLCTLLLQQTCATDSQCSVGGATNNCVGGKCLAKNGALCSSNGDCVSNICTAGVCVA